MSEKRYPTDLSEKEWALLEPLLPAVKPGGRKRSVEIREVANAIFYLLRTGGSWRMLPQDFPKWQTVYTYFRDWKRDGTWKKVNDVLRRKIRLLEGRDEEPSASILDSQSAKTAEPFDQLLSLTLFKHSLSHISIKYNICSLLSTIDVCTEYGGFHFTSTLHWVR